MQSSRRGFITLVMDAGIASVSAGILFYADAARAQTPTQTPTSLPADRVLPSDPVAKSLAYVEDATKVDRHAFPTYVAGQDCSSCSLYQGRAHDAYGGCTLFGKKVVAARGWCRSYSTM